MVYFVFSSISSLQPSTSTQAGSQSQTEETFPEEFTDDTQQQRSVSNADTQSSVESYAECYFDRSFSPGSVSQTSAAEKRKASHTLRDTNKMLRLLLSQPPKPSDFVPQNPFDFIPQNPSDDIQPFFDSMVSTVRKFSPLSIARIKLKIAQIVGEEEIAWADNASKLMQSNREQKKMHKQNYSPQPIFRWIVILFI